MNPTNTPQGWTEIEADRSTLPAPPAEIFVPFLEAAETARIDRIIERLDAEFMSPEITFFTDSEARENCFGGEHDSEPEDGEDYSGYWHRLSAAGYMDCTDWTGAFATEAEARADLAETYGDDLPDDDDDDDDFPQDDEPTEDDITTRDRRTFYQYGKLWLRTTQENYVRDVRRQMDVDKFWPNVWLTYGTQAELLDLTPEPAPDPSSMSIEEIQEHFDGRDVFIDVATCGDLLCDDGETYEAGCEGRPGYYARMACDENCGSSEWNGPHATKLEAYRYLVTTYPPQAD